MNNTDAISRQHHFEQQHEHDTVMINFLIGWIEDETEIFLIYFCDSFIQSQKEKYLSPESYTSEFTLRE